mmetsp:Transcript_53421/g.172593  ORF Transcript_53421/g.172593 Transcript_53421/m.172593 type:complete len:209 (-) Transcript_53421:63-689(-)
MKGQHTGPTNWEAVKIVKSRLNIPVFLNGGIETFEDVERCLAETGVDGVMSSEALLETPSLFSGRHVSQDQLTAEYLELAKIYDAPKSAVKAHVFRFLYAGLQTNIDLRAQLGAAKTLEEIGLAAAAVRERRSAERAARGGVEDPERPDAGWYRRYRNPLGDLAGTAVTRAARKAAATAAPVASEASAPAEGQAEAPSGDGGTDVGDA